MHSMVDFSIIRKFQNFTRHTVVNVIYIDYEEKWA